jgi:hypothetical protein
MQKFIALGSFPDRDGLITRSVQQDSFNHEGQCRAIKIRTKESSKDRPWIVHRTHDHESNMIPQVK